MTQGKGEVNSGSKIENEENMNNEERQETKNSWLVYGGTTAIV
jgi:hypothetical protein